MKRLALFLCAILIVGIAGTGALAKKGGNGKSNPKSYGDEERHGPPEWANRPEWAGSGDDDTEETETEEAETEETEETEEEANGKAFGKNKETPKAPADYNGLNKRGNSRHLYLYEKDPEDPSWPTVEGGAWGKMTYRPSGQTLRYVFTGHGLEPGVEYALIYYPDPWPGEGLVCLGSAMANQGGQVHIADRIDTGDIPMENDDNYPDGGKIWLVLSDDATCGTGMIGWNPTEYLFEYNLTTFDDTDYTQETTETEETEGDEGGDGE